MFYKYLLSFLMIVSLKAKILIVILGGGKSECYDSNKNKLLEPIAGKAMINHVCKNVLKSAEQRVEDISDILVVLGEESLNIKNTIESEFSGEGLIYIDSSKGRAQAMKDSVAYAKKNQHDGIIVLFGSMPTVSSTDIIRLIDEAKKGDNDFIRYEINCRPSHPVYIHKKHFNKVDGISRLHDTLSKDKYKSLKHSNEQAHIKSKDDMKKAVKLMQSANKKSNNKTEKVLAKK